MFQHFLSLLSSVIIHISFNLENFGSLHKWTWHVENVHAMLQSYYEVLYSGFFQINIISHSDGARVFQLEIRTFWTVLLVFFSIQET